MKLIGAFFRTPVVIFVLELWRAVLFSTLIVGSVGGGGFGALFSILRVGWDEIAGLVSFLFHSPRV